MTARVTGMRLARAGRRAAQAQRMGGVCFRCAHVLGVFARGVVRKQFGQFTVEIFGH